MITIGLVQAPATKNTEKNLETIKKYIVQAKENRCQVLCFPESFLTGYFPEQAKELALSVSSLQILTLFDLAKEFNIDILVGFMERTTESFYLTQGIFFADGTYDYYRKTHLGEREKQYFSSGDSLKVFTLSCGLIIGIQLCVETHYNDITQTLSLRGAHLIFAPHATPMPSCRRKKVWEKFIPARSYDNRVYMACCNQCDKERFFGGCLVTNPEGELIAEFFEPQENLLTFSMEETTILQYHLKQNIRCRYYPAHRKPYLYD